MRKEAMKLALEALAVKFSKGWHEGIKIDASDIMLLNDAAQALAEPDFWEGYVPEPVKPAQRPIKTFHGGKAWPVQEPAQRTWEEWFKWWRTSKVADSTEAEIDFADFMLIVRAVEAEYGIKEST